MKAIYKYVLEIGDQNVSLPVDAQILSVQYQNGTLCFWAVVDSPVTLWEVREFIVKGTGHPFEEEELKSLNYLETVQQDGFVWHVFEKMERK